MSGRRRPPCLRVVGTDIENRQVEPRSAYPLLDSLKVAVAPLEDAARCMADDAVRVVVDAAADFGFPVHDTDSLREEVRAAVIRFSLGWIAQRLAEYRHD
jgi:hypothetical protein